MIDIVINVTWVVGIIVGWYPVYERVLKELGSDPPESIDRFFAWLMSGVLIFFWPIVVAGAFIGPLVFSASERLIKWWRKLRSST